MTREEGNGMDASAIYQRLPGLTEGETVILALAYRLGVTDAHSAQTTGAAAGVRTGAMPGPGTPRNAGGCTGCWGRSSSGSGGLGQGDDRGPPRHGANRRGYGARLLVLLRCGLHKDRLSDDL